MNNIKSLCFQPGASVCEWKPCNSFDLQWFNKEGSYEIGDGGTYTMMKAAREYTPWRWSAQAIPIEYNSGEFIYVGIDPVPVCISFKTRFSADTTQIRFDVLVNGNIRYSHCTPLIHQGFPLSIEFCFNTELVQYDAVTIQATAVNNIGSCIAEDVDPHTGAWTTLFDIQATSQYFS